MENCLARLHQLIASSQLVKALLLSFCVSTAHAVTPPGTVISNTAVADYDIGGPAASTTSNSVSVVTTIITTASSVTLYQYDSSGTGALNLPAPSQYSSSATPPGNFIVSADPVVPVAGTGLVTLNPNNAISLNPVDAYHTGEPVFIVVQDGDQNLDPNVREAVIVIVTSSTGDREDILLTETGNDTGLFIGYVQSGSGSVNAFDGEITLGEDSRVTASYTDQYDSNDTSVSSTLVDPFGIIFSSADGTPVDGVVVTIVDSLGNPATVYGDNGVPGYPNQLVSGGSVTFNGTTYNFPPGGYRFPMLVPGNYRIVLSAPTNYQAPSGATEAELQNLPGAPFAIDANASYGNVFNVPAGAPLRVDIPIDPLNSLLVLSKRASTEQAAIGDFVRYTLQLENRDITATAVSPVITDVLPMGMRYQNASVRVNGVYSASAEPVIDADGRTLRFTLNDIAPASAAVTVSYVTEITSGVKPGKAVNIATAVDASNNASNTASAAITVSDDLFSNKGFIVGRVYYGECRDEDGNIPAKGLADVKLYLEDGVSVVTDANGQYHFKGLNPGSHVVQLDLQTLSGNVEVVACEADTQYAGTPYSKFVDIQGGTLWRADFYVRDKPPIHDRSVITVNSEMIGDDVKFSIDVQNGAIALKNYRLIVSLPEGLQYVAGSSMLDRAKVDDPYINDQVLVYRIGDMSGNRQRELAFRARIKVSDTTDLETTTVALFDVGDSKNLRSQPVKTRFAYNAGLIENRKLVFQALFKPMSAELSADSRQQLDALLATIGDALVTLEKVIGHSDNVPIRSKKGPYLTNEALSKARAASVAEYLSQKLGIELADVEIIGMGPAQPVASNHTAKGRAQNRRVEIFVKSTRVVDEGGVEVIWDGTQSASVEVVGRPEQKDKHALKKLPQQPMQDIEMYDAFWLKTAKPGTEWLMPQQDYYAPIPAVNIAIKHAPGAHYEMRLNGEPVNPLFFFGTLRNDANTVARSYWQGVHLQQGENLVEFVLKDERGNETERLQRRIVYAGQPVSVELDEELSRLVADGTHTPVLVLRFYDKNGHYARPGTVGTFEVNAPYLPQQLIDAVQYNRLTGLDRGQPQYKVGAEGIALVELEPTTAAGKVSLKLPMANGDVRTLTAWLQPEMRDWIMVGLAEGTVGYKSVSGNLEALDQDRYEEAFHADGRVAFFAKGRVKGEWLLTASFDSDRGRILSDNRVNQLIDPDTYYTIYGDATRQKYEASSAEKLYIKIEKQRFYALFGDYDTDLVETELSRYSRRMTGLKTEYEHDDFSIKAFAAESLNRFMKEEIQGDGTSGLYRLTAANLVINSEKIRIETRDRFRSEVILDSRELKRHIDYSIDYRDGSLYFRQPVASRDAALNPIYIVIDYEVEAGVKGSVTAGGRAALKLLDQRLEVGVSAIREGNFANEGNLYGADVSLRFDQSTVLKAEIATSDGVATGNPVSGNAWLAELKHESHEAYGRLYLREQQTDFGLGQQSGTQTGTTKYGAEGRYKLSKDLTLNAEAYHERVHSTNAKRNVISADAGYRINGYSFSGGARIARDTDGNGQRRDSELLLLGVSRKLFENQLQFRANAEVAVNNSKANPDYPSRYVVGVDYLINPSVSVFAENEWTDGASQNTQISRAGISASPWHAAQLTSTVNREVQENGIRSFATLGLVQGFRINDRWSADIAIDRTETLRDPGAVPFNANVAIAQGTANNDFTAVSLGATYRGDNFTVANRLEQRNAEQESKTGAVIKWERNIIDGIGYSLSTELFDVSRSNNTDAMDLDIRFSLGYRPLDSKWIVLSKLEYKLDEDTGLTLGDTRQRKLIENVVANYRPDDDNQFSINYGLKYVQSSFDGADYDGITHLFGGEYRHDLSDETDIGLHGFTHYSANSGVTRYALGASFGWSFARNIWLSVGYNFSGFDDPDFTTAGYTASGPYMKFRVKFDQDTAKQIQNWLN